MQLYSLCCWNVGLITMGKHYIALSVFADTKKMSNCKLCFLLYNQTVCACYVTAQARRYKRKPPPRNCAFFFCSSTAFSLLPLVLPLVLLCCCLAGWTSTQSYCETSQCELYDQQWTNQLMWIQYNKERI